MSHLLRSHGSAFSARRLITAQFYSQCDNSIIMRNHLSPLLNPRRIPHHYLDNTLDALRVKSIVFVKLYRRHVVTLSVASSTPFAESISVIARHNRITYSFFAGRSTLHDTVKRSASKSRNCPNISAYPANLRLQYKRNHGTLSFQV